jgi:3-hydroxyisobutyrate dehydrogenase-like beta-hydroxyacid dehydrogenase
VTASGSVVAVVGTGRMGSAMARALARAGCPLVLYNRTPDRAAALAAELGARVATTPAEAASLADVCLTMLADDAAVDDVYRGPDGLLAGARSGSVLVDLSTVSPAKIRLLEADARAAGVGLLDSPVSGSVGGAESGQLTLMVGGDAEDLARARPALEPLAKAIVHVGPLGSGAAMKLAVNTVVFGLNEAVAEGLVLAESAGIDRDLAYGVIAESAVGAPFVAYKRPAFVDPDRTPVAFALNLAEKDLRLIAALAAAIGVPMPQSNTNLEVIRAAAAELGGDVDFAAVAMHLRTRVGQSAGGPPRNGSVVGQDRSSTGKGTSP